MSGMHLIPGILFGSYHEVVGQCRQAATAALRAGEWRPALARTVFRPLEEFTGSLVVDLSPEQAGVGGEHIFLSPLLEEIHGLWFRKGMDEPRTLLEYPLMRHLIVSGMDEFWFCLVMLGDGGWLKGCTAYEADKATISRIAAWKLLRWWDDFVALHDRFDWRREVAPRRPSIDWYSWGKRLVLLCLEAGMPIAWHRFLVSLSATAAAGEIRHWLAATEPRLSAE